MFGRIQDELAEKIASALFEYGREKGAAVLDALRETDLRDSGRGLPPPLLVAYQEAFVGAFTARAFSRDGYSKWPHKGGEHEFDLLLRQPLVDRIQKTDWVKAASKTEDGIKQISALGGSSEYQAAVSSAVGRLFDYTVSSNVGIPQSTVTSMMWAILSPVIVAGAAREGTAKFEQTGFLYWCSGLKPEVAEQVGLAVKLLTTGSLWWKKRTSPSAGPYLK